MTTELSELIRTAEQTFNGVNKVSNRFENGYMILSDLCGSTAISAVNLHAGAALQAAHEALAAKVAGMITESPKFKSLGDGVMIEVHDVIEACQIALRLIRTSRELRQSAEQSYVAPEFRNFVVKVVVVSGQFSPAPETQRWLGLLPTKAARLGPFSKADEIWIDSGVAENVRPHLTRLNADIDYDPINGAVFNVLFKGFTGQKFLIHQLQPRETPSSLTMDEREKELWLTWSDVMAGSKKIVEKIKASNFKPRRVIGIGRSGAIVGGIIAGNLPSTEGHIPIDTIERTQQRAGAERVISTLTIAPEYFKGGILKEPSTPANHVWWEIGPVLLAMGEAKTQGSFQAAMTWLERRGICDVKTAALVQAREGRSDFFGFKAQNAWLPWQFTSGYDQSWPTYQEVTQRA